MDPASFTGGARIGQTYWDASNYSWPLATLTINGDEIHLKSPFKLITLRRDQIKGIRAYRGIVSNGIQIDHTSAEVPPFLVFWASSPSVAAEFRHSNYAFQEADPSDRPSPRYGLTVALPLFALVFWFLFILGSCFHRGDGTGEAVSNATVLTAFPATVYFILWKKSLRRP